jgi:hypothetical protein
MFRPILGHLQVASCSLGKNLFILSVLGEGKWSMRSHSLWDIWVGGGVSKLISFLVVDVFWHCGGCVVACWAVIQLLWYFCCVLTNSVTYCIHPFWREYLVTNMRSYILRCWDLRTRWHCVANENKKPKKRKNYYMLGLCVSLGRVLTRRALWLCWLPGWVTVASYVSRSPGCSCPMCIQCGRLLS